MQWKVRNHTCIQAITGRFGNLRNMNGFSVKRYTPVARKLATMVFGVIARYHALEKITEKFHFVTSSPGLFSMNLAHSWCQYVLSGLKTPFSSGWARCVQ